MWGREGRPGALEPMGCLLWAGQTSSAGHGTTFPASPFLAGSNQHGLCSKGRRCAVLWHRAGQGSGGALHTGSHPPHTPTLQGSPALLFINLPGVLSLSQQSTEAITGCSPRKRLCKSIKPCRLDPIHPCSHVA